MNAHIYTAVSLTLTTGWGIGRQYVKVELAFIMADSANSINAILTSFHTQFTLA